MNSEPYPDLQSLQAFKDYVHQRLDAAGVSADPPSTHRDADCRIGGRLDELIAERDELRARLRAQGITPGLHDFAHGVVREASRQRLSGQLDDAIQSSADWFLQLGEMARRAFRSASQGDFGTALANTVSSAALLANWYSALQQTAGVDTHGAPTPSSAHPHSHTRV